MKGFVLLAVGVIAGFLLAHVVRQTPRGRAFLDEVGVRATSFRSAVAEGYRAQSAELADR